MSEEGITPSTEKVEAIQLFPTPKNRKQLQSFLGICNYYRKFQDNYSEITAKFQKQLSSKDKWAWGPEQDKVLQLIKEKFLETVMSVSYTHLDVYKRQIVVYMYVNIFNKVNYSLSILNTTEKYNFALSGIKEITD